MNTVSMPVAHPTLCLTDIAPGKSRAYSPNLHKYLKVHGYFHEGGGIAQGVYAVQAGTKAAEVYGAGALMIGYVEGDELIGARLHAALSEGAKAVCIGHPIGNSVVPVDGFWETYLQTGRCAVDPAHQDAYMGDRFIEKEGVRTCRWCGHRQRKVFGRRVVLVETWVSE